MKTTFYLRKFIIFEHFFFINRSYLIEDVVTWIFCNIVFFTITCSVVCAIIFDIMYAEDNAKMNLWIYQFLSALETWHLASAARSRKSFPILDMIDKKCSEVNNSLPSLKGLASSSIVYLLLSTLLDSIGFFLVDVPRSLQISLFIGTAAHDAEMIFYSLMIKGFSLRLSMLEKLNPYVGAKIYGRILIGTANLSADFFMRVLLMLLATFFKTVIYLVLFIFSDYAITPLTIYMGFRELKALHSVWVLCAAAAESDSVCQALAFHLASRIVSDPTINKSDPKSPQYKTVSRWLAKVSEYRPKYITGSILSIDMAVLIDLIDLGIGYGLIVFQMYTVFF